jgi:hypothetical protein
LLGGNLFSSQSWWRPFDNGSHFTRPAIFTLILQGKYEAFGHSVQSAASLAERLAWLMQINFNGLLPVMDNEV